MAERVTPFRRFLNRPNSDPVKALGMAALIAALCALTISSVTVILRPLQDANRMEARNARMTALLEGVPGMAELLEGGGVETFVVDLGSGTLSATDPLSFDQQAAAQDPERSIALSPAVDLAAISRRENESLVWMVREGEALRLLILPLRGAGYQSTISAWLALEGDLSTVAAFTVHDQAETPGLGARVAESAFQDGWRGRQIFDQGTIMIDTAPGATGPHEVEMISGASVTSYATVDMVHFWLGEDGFGPFLQNLREGMAWP